MTIAGAAGRHALRDRPRAGSLVRVGILRAAMPAELGHISREQLLERIDRGDELVLVDALSPMSYAASHLPGAINIPPKQVDERASRRIPDLDAEVVVYCAGSTCDSSVIVANRLIQLGYRRVLHYAEGKDGWTKTGLPLEGGRA